MARVKERGGGEEEGKEGFLPSGWIWLSAHA